MDALDEAGIPTILRNEQLVGMIGELPQGSALPTIWVMRPEDWDEARAVVREFEARRAQVIDTELTCGACGDVSPGNFELCWKCRAPLG
jgi:hypothetical protein